MTDERFIPCHGGEPIRLMLKRLQQFEDAILVGATVHAAIAVSVRPPRPEKADRAYRLMRTDASHRLDPRRQKRIRRLMQEAWHD